MKTCECGGELMGIEIPGVYDGILYWHCLQCNRTLARFSEDDYRTVKYRELLAAGRLPVLGE